MWQPLSFAHNLDHSDYSQLLRLVRRRAGTALPSYEQPLRVFDLGASPPLPAPGSPPHTAVVSPAPAVVEGPTSHGVATGTLGERCLAWCLEEAVANKQPSAERIAWYHKEAVRKGRPLGISVGNHCASAHSRALKECLLPGEVAPHEYRAGAIELQQDAIAKGRWRSRAEVLSGNWLPRPGDLAIYTRANPADPSTAWWRHVDRVIQVTDDGFGSESDYVDILPSCSSLSCRHRRYRVALAPGRWDNRRHGAAESFAVSGLRAACPARRGGVSVLR